MILLIIFEAALNVLALSDTIRLGTPRLLVNRRKLWRNVIAFRSGTIPQDEQPWLCYTCTDTTRPLMHFVLTWHPQNQLQYFGRGVILSHGTLVVQGVGLVYKVALLAVDKLHTY